MRYGSTYSLLIVALSLMATPLFAQAPDSLSFQGFVTATGGAPINNPGVSITFKLYEGSSEIWSETQPSVKIEGGVFNVLLGSVTPLDTVRFNRPLLLGITVGADPEISPRTPLAAAAYAKALPGLYTFYRDDGDANKSHNVVGGAANNFVGSGVTGATIGGGGGFVFSGAAPNSVLDDFGTVSGGWANTANGEAAAVGGGLGNVANGIGAAVGGGLGNTAGPAGAIGGGQFNFATGNFSTVPGGSNNNARGGNSLAAGQDAKANHGGTFVWADRSFALPPDTFASTAANQFLIRASGGVGIGTNSPDAGSLLDVAGAIHISGGVSETMLFKNTNASGTPNGDGVRLRYDSSFNGGDYFIIEKTDGNGTNPDGGIAFVNTGSDGVVQTALLIKGNGRIGIGTGSPVATMHIKSTASTSVVQLRVETTSTTDYARLRMRNSSTNYWDIAAGGTSNNELNLFSSVRGNILSLRATGSNAIVAHNGATLTSSGMWTNASSFEKKTDFEELDAQSILETLARLPVRQWRYKVEPESVKHVGPTAEDFHEAFELGESAQTIGTVDADGIALAAIQGLYELVQEQQALLAGLQADNEQMRAVMARAGLE